MEDTAENECIVKDYIGETQSLEQEVKDGKSDRKRSMGKAGQA